jgi:hypothetical protein
MKPLVFEDGAIEIDAAIVADGLGIAPALLQQRMRAGEITSLSEEGIDADKGRYRLTFFSRHRRFRLEVDASGAILRRSTLDYGERPLPAAARDRRRPDPRDANGV